MFPTKRRTTALVLLLLFSAGCGLLLYRSGFFAAIRSVQTLLDYIQNFSPYSHLCFFLLQLLSVILAPIPSNITAAAGGLLFGTLPAFLLTFAAVVLGSLSVFAAARALGQPFAERFVSRSTAQKYLPILRAKAGTFLTLAFLFPFFPDDLLCILAGLSTMPPLHFLLIVLLARPWGLLFASALGGSTLILPAWTMALFAAAGLILFLLGMKYGDRVETALIARFHPKNRIK